MPWLNAKCLKKTITVFKKQALKNNNNNNINKTLYI